MRGDISPSENEVGNSSMAKRQDIVDQAIGMTSEKCQFGLSKSAIEVLQLFLGNIVVLKKLLSIPFFQSVVDEVHVVRSILIHLPLFSSLLALNQDLLPIIYSDKEFGPIVKMVVDVKYDLSTRLEKIGNYVENKIGHCLILANEHVCIYTVCYCNR